MLNETNIFSFFQTSNSNFLSSLYLNAPDDYSIRPIFSCLLRLFYLMCFNLYIKNVNARTDGEMKFDRWWKRQIWRQSFVSLVEHAFYSLSIPGSGNIFSPISRASSRLKYPTRWRFSVFLCCGDDKRLRRPFRKRQKIRSDPSYSEYSHFRSCPLCSFNKNRMKFKRKNMINRRLAKWLWRLCLSSINMRCVCLCVCSMKSICIVYCWFIIFYYSCALQFGTQFVAPKALLQTDVDTDDPHFPYKWPNIRIVIRCVQKIMSSDVFSFDENCLSNYHHLIISFP